KGDRLEWMVQKLTELGVSDMVFVDCERSVVKWTSERGAQQLLRLTRVAREAAMQSRRVWLPALRGPLDYADVIALPGAVIADPDGGSLAGFDNDPHSGRIVVIGPEGGFSAAEVGMSRHSVSLGQQILRVETAAVCAAVLLSSPR
ncbi:MAG: RNA methyltransferase, partial [Actinobacteria bacterium]|nr:RNA methyltransferase [Actinomycetota bacterium]